jgi:hypothetical protein
MDEEKIKRLREKIAYLRKMGKEGKAMNLERRIEQAAIKKEYKENRKPSKVGNVLRKIKKGVSNAANTVVNEVKETVNTVKKVKKAKVKKEKKPKTNTTTSSTSTSVSGTYGLAYGKNGEKGVGSVTYNGKTYKPGDQGYENAKGVFMETIHEKEAAEKRIQEIKKKKRNK